MPRPKKPRKPYQKSAFRQRPGWLPPAMGSGAEPGKVFSIARTCLARMRLGQSIELMELDRMGMILMTTKVLRELGRFEFDTHVLDGAIDTINQQYLDTPKDQLFSLPQEAVSEIEDALTVAEGLWRLYPAEQVNEAYDLVVRRRVKQAASADTPG